jgi:hypothetical protein
MSTTNPAPDALSHPLEKHLTTLVNCLQNVIYFIMLVDFIKTCMFFPCFAAQVVSPVESWKGLIYNMWFSVLVFGMMLAFKGTLETLLLFENAKRHRDGRKDATTIITANKDGAEIKHHDNGSASTEWRTIACYILKGLLEKANEKSETEEQEASKQSENESKPAATSTEDEIEPDTASAENEIKLDTASASSSARSSADTSDVHD